MRRFLAIATGSASEFESQLEVAAAVGCLAEDRIRDGVLLAQEVRRMLTGLMNQLDPAI